MIGSASLSERLQIDILMRNVSKLFVGSVNRIKYFPVDVL